MSITDEIRRSPNYACNGSLQDFPFAFKVFSQSDVRVVLLDALSVETDLVLTTEYTVTLNPDQDTNPGGTVATVSTYASGNYITVSSKLENSQPMVLTNHGGFYPTALNDAFDRATILIQQLKEQLSRAALLPISGIGDIDPASLFFGINSTGTASELKSIADLGSSLAVVSPFMLAVLESINQSEARTALLAAKSGANTDITSLSNPALGSATATTQALTDNTTKLATTAFVQALAAAVPRISMRQTVLSGPIDSSGAPNLGGATGSTSVTATGTIIVTSSQGHGAAGDVDRVGSISNPSWTGLSTNGTMYLYVDIATNGTCTTGAGTLEPVYQMGGTPAVTSGQFTFNIQEMTGYVGNGSAAVAAFRVYVGQVTVATGVVSDIKWYAYQGRSAVTQISLALSTQYSLNHNVGCHFYDVDAYFVCTSTELGYAVGDKIPATMSTSNTSSSYGSTVSHTGINTLSLSTGGSAINQPIPKAGGAALILATAKWKFEAFIKRSF